MKINAITAQQAAAMENLGHGKFEVRGNTVLFHGPENGTAIWQFQSKRLAEISLASWRRVFGKAADAA